MCVSARAIDRCASTSCFLGRSVCDTKLVMQMLELNNDNRSSLDYGFFTAIGYAEDFSSFGKLQQSGLCFGCMNYFLSHLDGDGSYIIESARVREE